MLGILLTATADLVDRIHDSDEKIRAAICKTIGSLDYETALHHVSVQTLTALGGRMSDKKVGEQISDSDTRLTSGIDVCTP